MPGSNICSRKQKEKYCGLQEAMQETDFMGRVLLVPSGVKK
jgi:hypothetical protein